jgi:hypothetical protein
MDVRGRQRRSWIVFWVALVGIPVLAYVGLGVLFAMTGLFLDLPRG